ncbi:IS1595 family transposase, partial [Massilia sp. X63]
MQAASFRKWLEPLAQLSRRQREQLLERLRPAVDLDRVCAAIEGARAVSCCPSCRGQRLHRHGHDRGVQR